MLDNIKIGKKLVGAFIIVALIAAVIGGIGTMKLQQIEAADTTLYERITVPISQLMVVGLNVNRIRVNVLTAATEADATKRTALIDRVNAQDKEIEENLVLYEKTIISEEMRKVYNEFMETNARFDAVREKMIELLRAGKLAEVDRMMDDNFALMEEVNSDLDAMMDMKLENAKATAASNMATADGATTMMIVLAVVGFIAALVIGLVLSGKISRGVNEVAARAEKLRAVCIANLGKGAEALAAGDLDYRIVTDATEIAVRGTDEIGQLARSLNGMIAQNQGTVAAFAKAVETLKLLARDDGGAALKAAAGKDLTARVKKDYQGVYDEMKQNINTLIESLDGAMQQVAGSAEQVASAAEQISGGAQQLAQGTNEQASAIEEVSSSLQEMASMTKQNAGNAKEAKGMSDAAKSGAEQGVKNMGRMSAAMESIKKSSDDTAKIIKTIDEIAFQTNLLALNAAVEAARAGEAGMGFAVVADEVRKLAMRSAEAAKNTANLIEESVKNANNGVSINTEVMKNLEDINGQAKKVSEVMAEIAAASDQQTLGIDQVNKAIEQMNQVTQQAAANAEESASAAEELTGQAVEMQGMVGAFVISGGGQGGGRPVKKAAKAAVRQPAPAPRPAPSAKQVIPFDEDRESLEKF